MKTIIFPTDFSNNATHSSRYAGMLTKRLDAKLILLHVYSLPMVTEYEGTYQIEEFTARSRNEARESLQLFTDKFIEDSEVSSDRISQIIDYGPVSDIILETAKALKADMIVMGTKGATDMLDRWIGTNAEAVMKKAECPVWIIPQNVPVNKPDLVMYAADFEEDELLATHQLLSIVEPLGATCKVIHIQDYFAFNVGHNVQETVMDLEKEFKYDNDISIKNLNRTEIIEGLEGYLNTHKPDVLALATHDKSFWNSFFEPSITKHFVQEAKLPLLIFKKQNK
jgi:nucleotide-binding universal stress UspA family protein